MLRRTIEDFVFELSPSYTDDIMTMCREDFVKKYNLDDATYTRNKLEISKIYGIYRKNGI